MYVSSIPSCVLQIYIGLFHIYISLIHGHRHISCTHTYFPYTYRPLSYLQDPFQICTGLIHIYVAYLTKDIILAAFESRALFAVVQMCIGLVHKYV